MINARRDVMTPTLEKQVISLELATVAIAEIIALLRARDNDTAAALRELVDALKRDLNAAEITTVELGPDRDTRRMASRLQIQWCEFLSRQLEVSDNADASAGIDYLVCRLVQAEAGIRASVDAAREAIAEASLA